MNSRFLERLSALASLAGDPSERACLDLEAASYLARRGDQLDSSKIVQEIREEGLHLLSPRVSAWLNFTEGMQFHCQGCDPEARVKWSRCIAIARSSHSNAVLARALAWLAFCDYTTLRIESLVLGMSEAIRVLEVGNHEGRARTNLTLAQIFHLCGDVGKAREFYDKSRLACLESGDDVMLAALIHNMAWLRMTTLRNEELRGMPLTDDGKIVELASESTRNYESLIGSTALDVMTPLLGVQVDIIQKRYAEAVRTINSRLQDLTRQGLSRLNASLVADRAFCRAKLGDLVGAMADATKAVDSVSKEDHVDDLAVLHIRVARVYEAIGESVQSAQFDAMARTLWNDFDSLRSQILIAIDLVHTQIIKAE